MLYYAHVVNGDFDRDQTIYVEPRFIDENNANQKNVVDLSKQPWSTWAFIHAFYEFHLLINTVVTLGFWYIEGPFMVYDGFLFDEKSSYGAVIPIVVTTISHTLPMILIIFEWWHNSIVVTTQRIFVHFLFGLCYILMLVIVSKFYLPVGGRIYYSCDF